MESARAYYRAVVGDRTPRPLQDAFLDNGARLIDFLERDPGFIFEMVPWPDYYGSDPNARPGGRHVAPCSLPLSAIGDLKAVLRAALPEERCGAPAPQLLFNGQALIARFLLALSQAPTADLRLKTELQAFVREGDDVVGAVVESGGTTTRIRTRRGIIVAAGGFERNAAMRSAFGVPGAATGSMAPPGNTGKAIQAGIDIGADVDLMDQAWWSLGLMQPDGSATFTLGFDGGIFVDQNGRRFINESLAYDRAGRVVIDLLKEKALTLPFWLVFDDRDNGVPPAQFPTLPHGDMQSYRDAGLWVSAPTLGELAERIGVPAANLIASVDRFNSLAAQGEDVDFQRGSEPFDRLFTDGKPPLSPISRAPFHAAAFGLSDLGTKGGLRTDEKARVLDKSGKVLNGLYAAGNSMAAVSGTTYPAGGNPVGSSMVFAFIAALDLAGARCEAEGVCSDSIA
jgi:3-oxosteroid 1-dehydrogenase